jgi:hypothetical protein
MPERHGRDREGMMAAIDASRFAWWISNPSEGGWMRFNRSRARKRRSRGSPMRTGGRRWQSMLAGSEKADPGDDRLRTLPCAFSADARGAAGRTVAGGASLERVKGIEPSYSAWKAAALPLSYTRAGAPAFKRGGTKRMGFFAIRRGEVNANPSPACGRRGCPQALTPGPSP